MLIRLASALIVLSVSSAASSAQGVVGGRLLEVTSKRPAGCVAVALLDATSRAIARTYTRSDGTFELAAPTAGQYRWSFSAFGLQSVETEPAALDEATDSERDYLIELRPVDSLLELSRGNRSDTIPQVDQRTRPVMLPFPKAMRDRGITAAQAILAITVDERGRSDSASAFRIYSSDPEFFDNALAFVQSQRYRPARRDGAAVCTFMVVPIAVEVQTRSMPVRP